MWPFVSNRHIKRQSASLVIGERQLNHSEIPLHTPGTATIIIIIKERQVRAGEDVEDWTPRAPLVGM